jgi:hypothetical protein
LFRRLFFTCAVAIAAGFSPAGAQVADRNSAAGQVLGLAGIGFREFVQLDDNGWSVRPMASSFSGAGDARFQLGASVLDTPASDWSLGVARGGAFLGVGRGVEAGLSFSDGRWGSRSAFFNAGGEASTALLGLAPRSDFATFGLSLGAGSRFSVSVMNAAESPAIVTSASAISARAVALSYTFQPAPGMSVSLTSAVLDGRNLVVGASTGAPLRLGPASTSTSLGAGFNFDLGGGLQIGFDAAVAQAESVSGSPLLGTAASLSGSAVSLAISKTNFLERGDTLDVVFKKPLRFSVAALQEVGRRLAAPGHGRRYQSDHEVAAQAVRAGYEREQPGHRLFASAVGQHRRPLQLQPPHERGQHHRRHRHRRHDQSARAVLSARGADLSRRRTRCRPGPSSPGSPRPAGR